MGQIFGAYKSKIVILTFKRMFLYMIWFKKTVTDPFVLYSTTALQYGCFNLLYYENMPNKILRILWFVLYVVSRLVRSFIIFLYHTSTECLLGCWPYGLREGRKWCWFRLEFPFTDDVQVADKYVFVSLNLILGA